MLAGLKNLKCKVSKRMDLQGIKPLLRKLQPLQVHGFHKKIIPHGRQEHIKE